MRQNCLKALNPPNMNQNLELLLECFRKQQLQKSQFLVGEHKDPKFQVPKSEIKESDSDSNSVKRKKKFYC